MNSNSSASSSSSMERHLSRNDLDGIPVPERRRRRRPRSRPMNYDSSEKSLVQFSTILIVLGLSCVILQMVQFTNRTILSRSQPGLWCGTLFVISASVCLGLARNRSLLSTLSMTGCCLISLFMALILSSMSWIGSEAMIYCQNVWDDCFGPNGTHPQYNSTIDSSRITDVPALAIKFSDLPITNNSTDDDILSCLDLENFYCGFSIPLGRAMHSLLILNGILASTISFILATIVCTRTNGSQANALRRRLSLIYNISGNEQIPGRPITPWEFPPPSKDPISATFPFQNFPAEPPPPYQECDCESVSYL